ncbi:MAG: hypothetical protein IJP45_05040 [Paludibacteraceae bacterium]|nr:hypothetical protein [Paludibacteraceae bacterium]
MGKVVYEDPVHHISGKISRKFRTIYNFRKASSRKYTSIIGERSTPVGSAESANREKFRIVKRAAGTRSQDSSKMASDLAAWRTARNGGDKHSTFSGWLFYKGWLNFNESTRQVEWPDSL